MTPSPAPDVLAALQDGIRRLGLYDPDFKIETMGGELREQRTMADAAESMQMRTIQAIPDLLRTALAKEGVYLVSRESLAAALHTAWPNHLRDESPQEMATQILEQIGEHSDAR